MESGDKRNKQGRFKAGNPGGPGRPTRQTEFKYLRALSEECPLDTWREIVRAAVKRAKSGDARAIAWLSQYLIGQPKTKAVALTGIAQAERDQENFELLMGLGGNPLGDTSPHS